MVGEILIYLSIFMALYFAIFVFGTFFEYKDKIYYKPKRKWLPRISLIVPCYNEEENIVKTLRSILDSDYPKNNLEIIVVDDGSRDNTLKIAEEFAKNEPLIKVFHKENGGKYTALNFGIEKSTNQYIGIIDADSFLHKEALKKIMAYFENPKIMCVVSTIKIGDPKKPLAGVQYVEYLMGAFWKKAFSLLDSINVLAGPLSIFDKKVFRKIGLFKKAHQTEDLEMAFRMQRHNLKIAHTIDAIVYTNSCQTFKALLRQRLRWRRGFLLNLKDYPDLLNVKKHGNLAFLIASSVFGSFLAIGIFAYSVWKILDYIFLKIKQIFLVKSDFFNFSFSVPDWIKINITPISILGLLSLLILFAYLFLSKKLTQDSGPSKMNVLFYLIIFPFINAIFWIITFWSVILRRKEALWD